jgi:hypothetical protein
MSDVKKIDLLRDAIIKIETIIDDLKKSIEKLFDITKKCGIHQEAIDTLKVNYFGIKDKMSKDFEEKLEKSEKKFYTVINEVKTEIKAVKDLLYKGIFYFVGTLILTPLAIKLVGLLVEKGFPLIWKFICNIF